MGHTQTMQIFKSILLEAHENKHQQRNHTLGNQQKEMCKKLKKNGLMREHIYEKKIGTNF
jgi:hypothetical protein